MSSSSSRPARAPRRVPFPIFDEDDNSASFEVPVGHFLAQQPLASTPVAVDEPNSNWADGARPDTSTLSAADFDVSVLTGFLPPEEPIQRLSGEWEQHERLLELAQEEVKRLTAGGVGRVSDSWREAVERLTAPSIDRLTDLRLLRRAHVLLSFLGHFFTHSRYPFLTRVPAGIAVPWTAVSDKLGVPPVLSYADTVLWNWRLVDRSRGMQPDNFAITTTFTSTHSEESFFLLSLLCELYGPLVLRLMSATLDEAFFADAKAVRRIGGYLTEISTVIDQLSEVMAGATKGSFGEGGKAEIVPEVFYWAIRPWFNGGKWTYENAGPGGIDQESEWGGPSAGQSSLVHSIDLFLGVDHSPRQASAPAAAAPTASSSTSTAAVAPAPRRSSTVKVAPSPMSDDTFMARASAYMPSHHRFFLHHLASLHTASPHNPSPVPSVRELAMTHTASLGAQYDGAVMAMKRFRDQHMRLVTVFIVSQARREPARESVYWPEWEAKRIQKEKDDLEKKLAELDLDGKGGLKKAEKMMGTGGTDLVTFLKACRERTIEAVLPLEE